MGSGSSGGPIIANKEGWTCCVLAGPSKPRVRLLVWRSRLGRLGAKEMSNQGLHVGSSRVVVLDGGTKACIPGSLLLGVGMRGPGCSATPVLVTDSRDRRRAMDNKEILSNRH